LLCRCCFPTLGGNGGGMLRAALGTAFLSAVTNLNRNYKPFRLLITADWNIPLVVRRYL